MRIVWSLPVRGERLGSSRGDLVRARSLIGALRDDGHDVSVVEDAARAGSRALVSVFRSGVRRMLPEGPSALLRDAGRWIHGCAHGARVAAVALERRAELIVETQVAFSVSGAHAAARTRLPLVVDDCSPSLEEGLLGLTGLPCLARRALRDETSIAARVVAVSEAARELLVEEGVERQKIALIPNGVDEDVFRRARGHVLRSELGLDSHSVIGFVGSFQPWHRIDLLMEALAGWDADFRVVLVGRGPELGAALASAEQHRLLDRVLSLGDVDSSRVPEIIAAFDIGVLPGTNDYGHPMKLVEYAAAGIPSVAPDQAPVREVLEDGTTGLLFTPGDPRDLAAAMRRLVKDRRLRARLGAGARLRALGRSSWRERSRQLLENL